MVSTNDLKDDHPQLPTQHFQASTGQAHKHAPQQQEKDLSASLYRFLNKFMPVPFRVPQPQGFTNSDWMHIVRTTPNMNGLNGAPPRPAIPTSEVRSHRTIDDCWVVLCGKVYNITPYIRYHPGGTTVLMKYAGRDATSAFMKHHPWVNLEAMLGPCCVGQLERENFGDIARMAA